MSKPKTPSKAFVTRVLEKQITVQCVQACALLGLKLERQNTGMGAFANRDGSVRRVRFGKAGDLDWRATLPGGRRFELEIKAPGKRPTREQYERMDELNGDGAVAFWTDCAAYLLRVLPLVLAGATVAINGDGEPEFTVAPENPN